MPSTLTTYQALLKERYLDSKDVVEKLMYPDNPFLGMLKKRGDTGMVGDKMPVPVFYGLPQGWSGSFSTAQTNASNTVSAQFDVEAGDYFGVVEIGDKVLKSSRTNSGAFLENKMVEIDGLYEQGGDNLSQYVWGNGGQAIGQIASISGDTFTLTDPAQACNFEIGMYLGASGDGDGSDATHTLRGSPSYSDVLSVNASSGVIGLDVSDIASLAAGDYLFRQSDFFGDQGAVVIKGVRSWIADTDSPAALWGVAAATRALQPTRLGGVRIANTAISGKDMEERIKILCAQATGRFKSKPFTAGFLHPERFAELDTLMGARGQRALEDESTNFGYMKIDIVTPSGRVPIYCDRHCPKDEFFGFRMDDMWISSIGELLHVQNEDGLDLLRKATATDYEFRVISYPLFACRAPKNSGRVNLVI